MITVRLQYINSARTPFLAAEVMRVSLLIFHSYCVEYRRLVWENPFFLFN